MATHCHYSMFGLKFEQPTIKQAWLHFCDVVEALDKTGLPDDWRPREWEATQKHLQYNARIVAEELGLPPYTFAVIKFGKDAPI